MTYEKVEITFDYFMQTVNIKMDIDQENTVEIEITKTETGIVVKNPREAWEKEEVCCDPKRRFREKAVEHVMKILRHGRITVKNLVFFFKRFQFFKDKENPSMEDPRMIAHNFGDLFITRLSQLNRRLNVEHVKVCNFSSPCYHRRENFAHILLPFLEPGKLKKISLLGKEMSVDPSIMAMEQFQQAEEFISDRFGIELFTNSVHSRILRGSIDTLFFVTDIAAVRNSLKKKTKNWIFQMLPIFRGRWRKIVVEFESRYLENFLTYIEDETPADLQRPNTKILKIQDSTDFFRVDVLEDEVVFTKLFNHPNW